MKKKLLTLAFLAQVLCANELETTEKLTNKYPLNYLETLEKDYKRDFFIKEFLQEDITSTQALDALSLASNVDIEMFNYFASKFNHDETSAVSICMQMDENALKDSYADCIKAGLTLKKASSLSSIDLDLIKQKIKDKYPTLEKQLNVISASIPFTKLIILKGDEIVDIYLNVSDDFKRTYFNYKLPKRTLNKISSDKENKVKFIENTILTSNLDKMQDSLNNFEIRDLNFDTTFLLALNAINLNKKDLASKYLALCLSKNPYGKNGLDKIFFYKYLLLKDEEILKTLAKSKEQNIYSLLAKELINTSYELNINEFDYVMPYEELFKDLSNEEKIFNYAYVKTKSNFYEKHLTKSYDLGAFSLNAKTLKEISKKQNTIFDATKQFEINENYNTFNNYKNNFKGFTNPLEKLLNMDKITYDNLFEEKDLLKKMILLEKLFYKKDDYKKFAINYLIYYKLINKEELKLLPIFEKSLQLDQDLEEKALN